PDLEQGGLASGPDRLGVPLAPVFFRRWSGPRGGGRPGRLSRLAPPRAVCQAAARLLRPRVARNRSAATAIVAPATAHSRHVTLVSIQRMTAQAAQGITSEARARSVESGVATSRRRSSQAARQHAP